MMRSASTVACLVILGACSSDESGGMLPPPTGMQTPAATAPPAAPPGQPSTQPSGMQPAMPPSSVGMPPAMQSTDTTLPAGMTPVPPGMTPAPVAGMGADPMDEGMGEPGMGEPGMGEPGMGEPGMGEPGMGEPGMGEPTDPTPSGPTAGNVMISFTTVTYGGQYAPGNYGAVWFEQPDGSFIKTAKRWAGATHASDLTAWTDASGGWGFLGIGGNTEDMMDAVSQATIRTHESHMVSWDFTDGSGELLPDGDYVIALEMSESRASTRSGPLLKLTVTKGPEPQTVDEPDQEGFSGISATYTP